MFGRANEAKKEKRRKQTLLFVALSYSSQHILCILLSSCVDNDTSLRIDNVPESSTPYETQIWFSYSRFLSSVLIIDSLVLIANQ